MSIFRQDPFCILGGLVLGNLVENNRLRDDEDNIVMIIHCPI